jgi:hypothetical protein
MKLAPISLITETQNRMAQFDEIAQDCLPHWEEYPLRSSENRGRLKPIVPGPSKAPDLRIASLDRAGISFGVATKIISTIELEPC